MSNDEQNQKPADGADREPAAKPPVKVDEKPTGDRTGQQERSKASPSSGKPRRGKGRVFAIILLLIVVAALAAGGWFGWQWLASERGTFRADIETQTREIERLRAELERVEETRAPVDELETVREDLESTRIALRDRLDRVTTDMEALSNAAQGGRRALLESEIEYLLRIAADELYLTQDVDTAIYALQTADDRLRQLGDPRLMPVRQLISDHLQQLRAVNLPDVSGMALKVGSLMREISDLPLRQAQHARAVEAGVVREEAQDDWWARVRSGVARLFDKLVVVQRAEPPAPLLAPEEHFFLYRNVELQLASARAALLAGDAAAWRQSLEIAREWLNRYFDTDNAEVRSVIADISGLLSVPLQPSLPEITSALERFRALARNGSRSE